MVIKVAFVILILIGCNGQVNREIIEDETGTKKVSYFDDGSILSEVYIQDNQPHGIEYRYYKSGKLSAQFEWFSGRKFGNQYEYYDHHYDTIIALDDQGEPMLTYLVLVCNEDVVK